MNEKPQIEIRVRQPGPMSAVFGAMEAAEALARKLGAMVEMQTDSADGALCLGITGRDPQLPNCTFRCVGPIRIEAWL